MDSLDAGEFDVVKGTILKHANGREWKVIEIGLFKNGFDGTYLPILRCQSGEIRDVPWNFLLTSIEKGEMEIGND